MISIDRLEEMAIEEFETKLNSWKEQVELQSNFIDSLLKATNNSEWLDKTILDDEASEIIEKIELDYVQLDQLKAENKTQKETIDGFLTILDKLGKSNVKLRKTLTEIKEIAESEMDSKEFMAVQCMLNGSIDNKNKVLEQILQKISECEVE